MLQHSTDKIIEQIYDSVTHPDQSRGLLESIVGLTGSNSGRLLLEKADRSAVVESIDVGFENSAIDSYSKYYFERDLWANSLDTSSSNHFFSSVERIPQKDYLNSEFYSDWAGTQNIHYASGMYLFCSDDAGLRLCVQRGKREGSYTAKELQLLNQLLPHLKHAFQLRAELNELQLLNQSTSQILDQLPFSAFLLDQSSHIHYQNSHAENLLRENKQILASNNRLAINNGPQTGFSQMVTDCISAGEGGDKKFSRVIQLAGDEEHSPLEVLVSPLIVDGFEFCFQYRKSMALVMVKDLSWSGNLDQEAIGELYGLTRTEVLICALLCKGLKISQIAATSNSSVHTVRTHLKHLLVKTNTNSQSQLVGKVLSGVASLLPRES